MDTRRIGQLEVSVVGLGCNNFGGRIDADQTQRVVDAALEHGITYFDTAESYGDGRSEELLGRALGSRRDEVVLATKWAHTSSIAEGGGRPEEIRSRLEASLERLGTDHVDHYQLHRPDPVTPLEETLGCLAELREEGKVREIGCTGFTAEQLRASHGASVEAGVPTWASVQNHYSVLTRGPERDGVFEVCDELGLAFVPYFPLESGLLTGKYRLDRDLPEGSRLAGMGDRAGRFIDDDRLELVEELIVWCVARGHTLLDLAISWHTSHPLVASVIAGATKPEQVASNVDAAGWQLTEEDRSEVDAILAGAGHVGEPLV
jgi:aryl-alcohol dehydrogenase-like predicted oxidoreductase